MTTTPQVSVLLTTYNDGRFVREALESILNQTFRDFELLVVDDASTDDTIAIVSQYKDARIQIIRNKENIGLAKSLNAALPYCRAPLVARQDGDDVSLPQRFEKQMQYMEEHPEVALLGTQDIWIDENGNEIPSDRPNGFPTEHEEIVKILRERNCFNHSSVTFRKDIVERLGGYRPFPGCQDYDLWARVAVNHKAANLSERLVLRTRRHGSISLDRIEAQTASATLIARLAHQRFGSGYDELEGLKGIELERRIAKSIRQEKKRNHKLCASKNIEIFHRILRSDGRLKAFRYLIRALRLDPFNPCIIRLFVEKYISRNAWQHWQTIKALFFQSKRSRKQAIDVSFARTTTTKRRQSGRPLVYAVVVTYNGARWIRECLRSLLLTTYDPLQILVVDNASSDGTASIVRDEFPTVGLISCIRNLGYGAGCNLGIETAYRSGADHIVILNQDVIVTADWLQPLVSVAEDIPVIGMLGPLQMGYKNRRVDPFQEKILEKQRMDFSYLPEEHKGNVTPVRSLIGAALFIPRRTIERVGGFDPYYFMYAEETDLCERVLFHGLRIALVKNSVIRHMSTRTVSELAPRVRRFFFRNQYVLFLKNPRASFGRNIYSYLRYGVANITVRLFNETNGKEKGFVSLLSFATDFLAAQAEVFFALRRLRNNHYVERRGPHHLNLQLPESPDQRILTTKPILERL